MVENAYKTQFYGVAVTLLLCSAMYRVAATAIMIGIICSMIVLLCIAIKSSFPEVKYARVSRRLKCDPPAISTSHLLKWKDSKLARDYPDVTKQLEEISELLVHNFVSSWFQHIDPEEVSGFGGAVKNTILNSISEVSLLLEQVDGLEISLLKLLPLLTEHLEAFRCASQVVQDEKSLGGSVQNTELQVIVEYNKIRKLHHCLSLKPSKLRQDVMAYMTLKTEKLLPLLIDKNELSSPFVFILLRDILTTCIFEPLVIKLSDSDFLNLLMISVSDKVLEERDQVSEVRRFLSREVGGQTNAVVNEATTSDETAVEQELRPGISGTQFELYLRQISQLSSLENLQKEQFLIIAKLLSLRNDKNASNSVDYEKRLLLSLNLLQTRLRRVDSRGALTRHHPYGITLADAVKTADAFEDVLQMINLTDILQEQRCLVFFEKFLTVNLYRRGICYLNFWKMTENMRNPLEDAHQDLIVTISPKEVAQLRDTAFDFFQNERLEFMKILDPGLVTNILLFVKDIDGDANRTFPLARRSILLLQSEAQRALQDGFFQGFKSSKIFLDMLASSDFPSTDLYTRIVANPHSRESHPSLSTRDCLSTIRVFTNPGIDDAIENILNRNTSERRRSYSRTNQDMTKDKPLEVNDVRLHSDTLFKDEEEDYETISLKKHNSRGSEESDGAMINESIGGFSQKHGDLNDRIAQLTVSVDQIEKQLELLNHLILKAELTNNQKQLKLLRKSQTALIRDIDNKELLKQQLVICQNSNSLFKKTKVAIKSYFVDTSHKNEAGVVYYLISVEHFNNGQIAAWAVPRRFSEFFRLHSYMKAKYRSLIKGITVKAAFPKKVKLSLSLHATRAILCQERKLKLERYIRELLKVPEICQDDLLREFLTDSATFSDSRVAKNMKKSKESRESSSTEGSVYSTIFDKGLVRQNHSFGTAAVLDASDEIDEGLSFFDDEQSSNDSYDLPENDQDRPFVKAICDMFISVFLLNRTNTGWLRGRAIVTILQQLMGSAIERYIVDAVTKMTSEAQLCSILVRLKNKLLERSERKNQIHKAPRQLGEIQKTQRESKLMFKCLFTEVCGKVVGNKNAQEAAIQLHEMAQNSYLTASIMLEILDTLFEELIQSNRHINRDAPEHLPVKTRNFD